MRENQLTAMCITCGERRLFPVPEGMYEKQIYHFLQNDAL